MARSITIDDLPDDMLHEIFGRVIVGRRVGHPWRFTELLTHLPAEGAHLALRRVCRRWRDIADWQRLDAANIIVDTAQLADVDAVRARHPAAFKHLTLHCSADGHTTRVSQAAASLINGSADLRRVLSALALQTCCLPALSPAVTPITSCTSLTKLQLSWCAHENERAPSNMLSPLSALRMLETLEYGHALDYSHFPGKPPPESAMLAPLPALPDAPRLTCLRLSMTGNFVPVGSDVALGRLRRLEFSHAAPVRGLLNAEDPFLLRTAFDAGTWRPSRLTGLQELEFYLGRMRDDVHAPLWTLPPRRQLSLSGSEWAPLARQVTKLNVYINFVVRNRPSTAIVAGLGVLTALRNLHVYGANDMHEPLIIDRLHAPHLTYLYFNCVSDTVSVAQFPNLVHLDLATYSYDTPLDLLSLVARSSLKTLKLRSRCRDEFVLVSINLAELFVGGGSWPVLEELMLYKFLLLWDTTVLAGAPTAVEFAERARQLLPALVRVSIRPARFVDSQDESLMDCIEYVVPALEGLDAGGDSE